MAKAAATQPWKDEGLTKPEWVARQVATIVNAQKSWDIEVASFDDAERPATCLEVDLPIVPINAIAKVESSSGAGRKPIYTMNKWWARRPSSVFRAILLAAAMKAPDDPAECAKLVWNVYYGNHRIKGPFKDLKVADIFMGGGTTVVEGSRLGMKMYGNDLNPVAWFVVKNEVAQIDRAEVETLLAEIEAAVKPQIIPFYACDCPRGHKGTWTQISTGTVMGADFDPLAVTPEDRADYSYDGPEVIYTFWAKHGPCQITDCRHRTPIMTSPVIAIKSLSIKYWKRKCKHCSAQYDIEQADARMAPEATFVISPDETPFAVATLNMAGKPESVTCPECGNDEQLASFGKPKSKKVTLSLLVHPEWLRGHSSHDGSGEPYGGSAGDDTEATARWNIARANTCKLVEVRGPLPQQVELPDGTQIVTGKDGGTVPRRSNYECGSCGTVQDVLETVRASGKTGPIAAYAIQGYCPCCDESKLPYNGRFFAAADPRVCRALNSVQAEWENRKDTDLADYWPRSELPFGFMTHKLNGGLPNHGFTHWWKFFNARQSFIFALLLRSHWEISAPLDVRMFCLSAIHRFLQHNNMLCFWDEQQDCLAPSLSNANYHPKNTLIENSVFATLGRGNYRSSIGTLLEAIDWKQSPWDLVSRESITAVSPELDSHLTGKSEKLPNSDTIGDNIQLECVSSTELTGLNDESVDIVVTDPPFGGLLHYSELSDFFYVWLRLVLRSEFPEYFSPEYTPKTLEAVANRARQPEDSDAFYQRVLTECWREARRVLKPGGLLAFTFHHSEDAPWVSVLESLFDSGFFLEATYPLRCDETKGAGEFGSRKIEYDIVHVCRKRLDEPTPISWPRLRRQLLQDVRGLKDLLEHHQEEGLPEADLQVIRRGKALEYFSRHYGRVFKDENAPMSVLEALLGINQLLDEEAGGIKDPPPHNAEPFTRMLLRLFDGKAELPRDQIQKFLRGTGSAPSDFVDRGWVIEEKKVYYLLPPLEVAERWIGKQRKGMVSDYDQAMFLIGACFESSGINASDTLNNDNFRPHPALGAILTWFKTHGADSPTRNAASLASQLFRTWETKHTPKVRQPTLFDDYAEDDE